MDVPAVWSLSSELGQVLDRLLPAMSDGPALLVGDDGENALRLARVGLKPVEVVVFSPSEVVKCRSVIDAAGLPATVEAVDAADVELPARRYAVVAVLALDRFVPRVGDRLIEQARAAARPGGLAVAAAATVDDARYARLRAEGRAVDRRTFLRDDGEGAVRFFVPGELAMAFEGWTLLHSVSQSLVVPDGAESPRAWAVVAARRPPTGTLLA